MKFYINPNLKNHEKFENLISSCIKKFKIKDVQLEVVYINFENHQNELLRSNIDEIEQIKCFSNKNFMYASYYNMSSKIVPSIIDEKSFNLIKKALSNEDKKFIEDCYVYHNDQFLLKTKIPELKSDINESTIETLFSIIQNDGFDNYVQTNMNEYFVFYRTLECNDSCLRLLFASREKEMESSYKVFHLNNIFIDKFLEVFQNDLLDVIKNFNEIQKQSLLEEDSTINLHHEAFCKEKLKVFVGRTEQILYAREVLNDPSVSHVIIHGESGCGKTR